jgi:hypothetical protein
VAVARALADTAIWPAAYFEHGTIFGESELPRRVHDGLPIASRAPRSTSSIVRRSSSNRANSSTSGWASRVALQRLHPRLQSSGVPVPIADGVKSDGPFTSTTPRRQVALSVRVASSSICDHAASEIEVVHGAVRSTVDP